MSARQTTNRLAPWASHMPSGWKIDRLGNVADIRFSNVDKHSFDEELPVRLCNYVDVYNNERITAAMDFMEASANVREVEKFQLLPGDEDGLGFAFFDLHHQILPHLLSLIAQQEQARQVDLGRRLIIVSVSGHIHRIALLLQSFLDKVRDLSFVLDD